MSEARPLPRWLAVAGLAGVACGLLEGGLRLWREPPMTAFEAAATLGWAGLGVGLAAVAAGGALRAGVLLFGRRGGRGAELAPPPAAWVGIAAFAAVAVAVALGVPRSASGWLLCVLAGAAVAAAGLALLARVRPPWPRRLDRVAPWVVGVALLVAAAAVGIAVRYADTGAQAPVGAAGKRNLLLVTVDTLRADRVGAYGYERARTPTMDAWAAEGVLFEEALAPSPFTCPSHASILTGLDPPRHGSVDNRSRLRGDAPSLASRLRSAGYETAAIVSSGPLRHRVCGLGQGFARYEEDLSPWPWLPQAARTLGIVRLAVPVLERLGLAYQRHYRLAEETTDAALAWLRRPPSQPFFLWIHYFDPHLPYSPPPPYDTLFDPDYTGSVDGRWNFIGTPARERIVASAEDVAHMIALYDGEVAYVDAQLARLREALERSGLAETTALVLTADHGESQGEHLLYFARGLYRPSLRVPLILVLPSDEVAPRRVSRTVRLVDLAPTLLEWLGLPPEGDLAGRSFLSLLRGDEDGSYPALPSYASYPRTMLSVADQDSLSVELDGWKLIREAPWWRGDGARVAPREELYHLPSDPAESRNLVERAPPELPALRERLAAWRDGDAGPAALGEDTRRMLEELGYGH